MSHFYHHYDKTIIPDFIDDAISSQPHTVILAACQLHAALPAGMDSQLFNAPQESLHIPWQYFPEIPGD